MTGFITITNSDGTVFSRYDLSTLNEEELAGLLEDIEHDLDLMKRQQKGT